MQTKYCIDDPPHAIKKVLICHDEDILLYENIFDSTEIKSVRVLYIFKVQVAYTRSALKNILKYAPCFVLLFREWMWTWTSDTWFFWTEEYWVPTEEETAWQHTRLAASNKRKVSGSSSVMSWKPLVFIRRIISSFVTSMEMDTTLFPNSFHQFNSLRGNFLCAWRPRGSEAWKCGEALFINQTGTQWQLQREFLLRLLHHWFLALKWCSSRAWASQHAVIRTQTPPALPFPTR